MRNLNPNGHATARWHRRIASLLSLGALFTAFAILAGANGCGTSSLIDGIQFNIEPNLETARIRLNFAQNVQSDLGGSFAIPPYGSLEVEPSTSANPFNVGFRMNLGIVNDPQFQNLVRVEPVRDLPSGQPIPIPGLNRAFARLRMVNEINPNFDIYVYVDAADNGREWIGVAMALKFLNNQYFPAGLSVSQQFLKKNNIPRGVAAVYGPRVDSNGNMEKPGGIAVFANVKSLIEDAKRGGPRNGSDRGQGLVFEGASARFFREHPETWRELEAGFAEALRKAPLGVTKH